VALLSGARRQLAGDLAVVDGHAGVDDPADLGLHRCPELTGDLADRAPDVRLGGDAVHRCKALIDAHVAPLAVPQADSERRRREQRVEQRELQRVAWLSRTCRFGLGVRFCLHSHEPRTRVVGSLRAELRSGEQAAFTVRLVGHRLVGS
jgi:hypothetical protein